MNPTPLVVDLDGTLVLTDTLQECFLSLLCHRPYTAFRSLWVIPRGRARFKEVVACATPLPAASIPFHTEFLAYLKTEAAAGRRLVLATGASRKIAEAIAAHLGLFEAVLSTQGQVNLTGSRKATALAGYFGGHRFVYAGNSYADVPIWAKAEGAVIVNAPPAIAVELRRKGIAIHREFPRTKSPAHLLLRRLPALFARPSSQS